MVWLVQSWALGGRQQAAAHAGRLNSTCCSIDTNAASGLHKTLGKAEKSTHPPMAAAATRSAGAGAGAAAVDGAGAGAAAASAVSERRPYRTGGSRREGELPMLDLVRAHMRTPLFSALQPTCTPATSSAATKARSSEQRMLVGRRGPSDQTRLLQAASGRCDRQEGQGTM